MIKLSIPDLLDSICLFLVSLKKHLKITDECKYF